MEFEDAKRKFIHSWGVLGNSWGLNKTMAQIHALLMISPKSLTTDDIIDYLEISRGNVSMSLKSLLDWGIVYKDYVPGERKDYYYAEKDVWKFANQVSRERRKRELIPVINMLDDLSELHLDLSNDDQKEFSLITNSLNKYAKKADKILSRVSKMESNWFFNKILNSLK